MRAIEKSRRLALPNDANAKCKMQNEKRKMPNDEGLICILRFAF